MEFRGRHAQFWKAGEEMKKYLLLLLSLFLIGISSLAFSQNLGNLSSNRYDPRSTSNPYGAGSPYNPGSVNNPYGQYGSPYSPNSPTNPYATDTPKLFDSQGNYRGKLSSNPYDSDSISNPYGRYGSQFSPESINNPFGAGNPFRSDSPNNPFDSGWEIKPPRR